ncbi:hypothetical protein CDAR_454691 [Caerostris darwini]|uniref:Uncharacterized protein n=1 Tax=Caerostris darwini TaxID=1538125 RepID=A0AAV4TWD4_9ARAC|nr:hypothetical protein CDAR_454691 [Caerostris darwini]
MLQTAFYECLVILGSTHKSRDNRRVLGVVLTAAHTPKWEWDIRTITQYYLIRMVGREESIMDHMQYSCGQRQPAIIMSRRRISF